MMSQDEQKYSLFIRLGYSENIRGYSEIIRVFILIGNSNERVVSVYYIIPKYYCNFSHTKEVSCKSLHRIKYLKVIL